MDKTNLKKATIHLAEAIRLCEYIAAELQESFDEKSDEWRESDEGLNTQEMLDELDSITDELGSQLGGLEEIATR